MKYTKYNNKNIKYCQQLVIRSLSNLVCGIHEVIWICKNIKILYLLQIF